ncbi:MAG: glycosyltransferase [Bacillota bacterium]
MSIAIFEPRIKTVGSLRNFVKNEQPQLSTGVPTIGDLPTVTKYTTTGFGLFAAMAPTIAHAQTQDDTFMGVWNAMMGIVDWLCVGVIVFAGTSWMFGHRTNAIQLMIGACAGYLLARHAIDIRDFLKTI